MNEIRRLKLDDSHEFTRFVQRNIGGLKLGSTKS